MTYRKKIELKGLPKTTNSGGRSHWAVKAKEARKWKTYVLATIGNDKPDSPLKKAKLTCLRASSVEPDFDGLVSSFKHIIDGLKAAGVIEDDKPSVIGQPKFKWMKVAPGNGFCVITIEGKQ